MNETERVAALRAVVVRSPVFLHVLRTARALALPDWMVFSGAVYQRVLNHLTGRDLEHGVKDYDLAYFDARDLSYEAEDVVIRRVAGSFEPPLDTLVEVRNQARVHLWFESKFGEPYPPLRASADALARFASPMFAVGVRLEHDDTLSVHAPFGLADLFALTLRPNPVRPNGAFARIAAGVAARWPEVRIEPA